MTPSQRTNLVSDVCRRNTFHMKREAPRSYLNDFLQGTFKDFISAVVITGVVLTIAIWLPELGGWK